MITYLIDYFFSFFLQKVREELKHFVFELRMKKDYIRNRLHKLIFHKDLILFVGKLRSHEDADTPSNLMVVYYCDCIHLPATIRSQR